MPENDTIIRWPLYIQVTELLKEEILNGKLEGSLPTEEALVKRFNVSRVTVRKAMTELKKKGLIRSYRGRGTFVSKSVPRVHSKVLRVASYYRNPDMDVQNQIYQSFEKRFPEIKIEPLYCADSLDYCDFLTQSHGGRYKPDVFMFSESQYPYLKHQGVFRELEKEKFMGITPPFISRPFEIFSKDDKYLYGVPFIFSPLVLFVNRSFFQQEHVPEFSSWDKLINVLKDMRNKDSKGYGFLMPYETLNRWPLFLLQRGVKIVCNREKDVYCMLNSNEAVETIKWLHDLRFHDKITSGLCPDSADLFTDNLGAVLLSSLYMLEKFEQNVVFDWEVQPIPTPSENYANMLIMTGFGISRQCKDVETAEQFIDHILSKEVQDLIASKNVSCPVRKSSLAHLSPRAKAHIDKIIDPEILNRSILLIDHPKINEIRQILQIETNKVWLNLESSASACRHIARKVNQCLQWHKWKQE